MDNYQLAVFKSSSTDETLKLGEHLGANLRGQEIIELLSDLGGGKTTLTKGLTRGAGSKDLVASPSFTLCNEYQTPKFRIYHFDFYRLNDPGIMRLELSEAVDQGNRVIVIEWPESIENSLPKERIIIAIKVEAENAREFSVKYTPKYAYLVKGLS